jgi:hypothetical protein
MGAITLSHAIPAALWPLVMVSATGPLIISIGNAHARLADQARRLASELRDPATTPTRLESVRCQLHWFRIRLRLSQVAHILLCLAVLCFVDTVALSSLVPAASGLGVRIFMLGTVQLIVSIVLQTIELSMAHRTIDRDMAS